MPRRRLAGQRTRVCQAPSAALKTLHGLSSSRVLVAKGLGMVALGSSPCVWQILTILDPASALLQFQSATAKP